MSRLYPALKMVKVLGYRKSPVLDCRSCPISNSFSSNAVAKECRRYKKHVAANKLVCLTEYLCQAAEDHSVKGGCDDALGLQSAR